MPLGWTTDDLQANVVLFALNGRLILGDDLQRLKKALETRARVAGTVVVLDLSRVDFADSSGIGVLLYVNGVARNAGSKLRLAAATRRILDVLRLTHTDRVLTIDPDVDISLGQSI